MDANNRNNCNT